MMLLGFIWLSPKVANLLLFGTLVQFAATPRRPMAYGESARRLAPWPCGELLRHNGRYKDNTRRRFVYDDSSFGKFCLKFLVPKTSTGPHRGISRMQGRRVWLARSPYRNRAY